jgi:hypothetical protein
MVTKTLKSFITGFKKCGLCGLHATYTISNVEGFFGSYYAAFLTMEVLLCEHMDDVIFGNENSIQLVHRNERLIAEW